MTQITIVNSTDQSGAVEVFRGGSEKTEPLSGRIAVEPEAVVIVPPLTGYAVYAAAELQGNTAYTGTVHLPDAAWRLTARLDKAGQAFEFRLVEEPGEAPELMTLIDTLDVPAVFTINAHATDPTGPAVLTTQLVVQPHDRLELSVTSTYAFYAVVGGYTTNTVKVDPRPGQDITMQIVDTVTESGIAAFGLVLVQPAAGDA